MRAENLYKYLFENTVAKILFALLAIFGGIITIFAFIEEKNVNFKYIVLDNTNVLDFNENVNKLDVIYDSTSLKKSNKNLRIFTIKGINIGSQNITNNLYDEISPFGIRISTGRIIEPPKIVRASSNYIKDNLKIKYINDSIKFSKIIIEPKEYFTIKVLVLHDKNKIPSISTFGKIAGQKNIIVNNYVPNKEDRSFWKNVFSGGFLVQSVRLISYLIFYILLLIIIGVSVEIIIGNKKKKKRIKLVSDFKISTEYRYRAIDNVIFNRYIKNGPEFVRKMFYYVINNDELNSNYKSTLHDVNSSDKKITREASARMLSFINDMINDGLIIKEDGKLFINDTLKETTNKFELFLRNNDLLFETD